MEETTTTSLYHPREPMPAYPDPQYRREHQMVGLAEDNGASPIPDKRMGSLRPPVEKPLDSRAVQSTSHNHI